MHVKQIDVVEGLKKRKETFNGAAHSILVGKGLPYRVGRLYVILLAIRRFSCNRIFMLYHSTGKVLYLLLKSTKAPVGNHR